ncbi:sulfocyanin-like copper-binding protein [Deinococcus ficus]|uniref:sulfocyanin-like copper-binding protein n=1 Tax=Deinococcus ficus TaxID=317577 RepID=UPI00174E8395|nr:sulfocyanin-like copper-binding protein [Deinococcus ficus]GHF74762.1 hypothetical protein GCM10017782_10580 [Deinococcus ficus]
MKNTVMTALLLASTSAVLAQTAAPATTTTPAQPPVITADAAKKLVKISFVAGHGTHNNGLNYNGDAKGEKTLTVPLGWTVEVSLSNAGRMPHDMAIVAGTALPADPFKARLAFPNAATAVVAPSGATAAPTTFVVNRPGSYFVLCRVGKHAQNGMYVKLNVVNGAKAVTYK